MAKFTPTITSQRKANGYLYTTRRYKGIIQKNFQGGKSGGTAPLLALIINKRLGRQGKPGLYGDKMRERVAEIWKKKVSSIGFLRAGFLHALNDIGRFLGKPVKKETVAWVARSAYRGRGIPARPGIRPHVTFVHAAFGTHSKNPRVVDYVKDGLADAMAVVMKDMRAHMERRLQRSAYKLGSRLAR